MPARPSRPSKKKEDEKEKPVSVDEAFLKNYVANAGAFARVTDVATGEEVSADEALTEETSALIDTAESDKKLNQALARGEAKARREQQRLAKLQAQAEKMGAASDERTAKKSEQQAQQEEEDAEQQRRETAQGVQRATHAVNTVLNTHVQPAIDKVGAMPAPGGIGLLLLIIGILLAVVVQVNSAGDTRLKQFWYMLNGRAKLQGRVDITKGSQNVGVGSTFGTPTTPTTSATTPTPATLPTIPTVPFSSNGTFHTTSPNLGF